jgi:hypothetical protein
MIRWFLRRWIDKFERAWNYDASYMRAILDTDPRALMAIRKAQGLTAYRRGVPITPYCAAGIVSAMAEDCGPCTQLAIEMAQRASSMRLKPMICARRWCGALASVVWSRCHSHLSPAAFSLR